MDQDAKEVGLGPDHIALDGDPVGTEPRQQPLPTFRPMSIVAKRSPISAIAELLLPTCPYWQLAIAYTDSGIREKILEFSWTVLPIPSLSFYTVLV